LPELTADLERAREALARGSWAEAYEGLREFDSSTLTAGDLEGLADAAWWISRMDESIAARQKAYAAYAAAAEDRPAAALAIRLCVEQRDAFPNSARCDERQPLYVDRHGEQVQVAESVPDPGGPPRQLDRTLELAAEACHRRLNHSEETMLHTLR
jgi:hypothetical protein